MSTTNQNYHKKLA